MNCNLDELIEFYINGNHERKPWQITMRNDIIDLDYFSSIFNAHFSFIIYNQPEFLELRNVDRYIQGPRRQSYGTQVLEELEWCFQKITPHINKNIKISFAESKAQDDTRSWLIKNDYRADGYDLYSRMLMKQ